MKKTPRAFIWTAVVLISTTKNLSVVDAIVNFLSQVNFFVFVLGMVMHANEVETKKK